MGTSLGIWVCVTLECHAWRPAFRSGDLSPNKHNIQELRTAAALAIASGFTRDHDHMIGLGIERAGFGAGLGLDGFFEHEFCGAFFLDDAQRAIAVRAKSFHSARIEGSTVAAPGQGQGGDDFAIDGTEDHASGRTAPSAATHRKKNVVLGIDGQACRPVAPSHPDRNGRLL